MFAGGKFILTFQEVFMVNELSQYTHNANYSRPTTGGYDSTSGATTNGDEVAAKAGQTQRTRQVQTLPGQDKNNPDGSPRDAVELSVEAQEIRKLQLRDREVRAHEAAHAAAGGAYAGSPSYTFERGADGQTYAVGGSVSIDMSPVKGDPEATLQKAQQVRAAALAPAQPSSQDMRVAQKAQAMAATARSEISQQLNEDLKNISQTSQAGYGADMVISGTQTEQQETSGNRSGGDSGIARLDIYT